MKELQKPQLKRLKEKAGQALAGLCNNEWLNLTIGISKIRRLYTKYVRSILIYGLILYDETDEIHNLDVKLVQILMTKLLWTGRKISDKHMTRLFVAIRLPSLKTVTERMAHQWILKLKETSAIKIYIKIKRYALKTIKAIKVLTPEHRLQKALRCEVLNWDEKYILRLNDMNQESSSINTNTSIKLPTVTKKNRTISFADEENLCENRRRAIMRWMIYRFPIKIIPTREQAKTLSLIPNYHILTAREKRKVTKAIHEIYEKEK